MRTRRRRRPFSPLPRGEAVVNRECPRRCACPRRTFSPLHRGETTVTHEPRRRDVEYDRVLSVPYITGRRLSPPRRAAALGGSAISAIRTTTFSPLQCGGSRCRESHGQKRRALLGLSVPYITEKRFSRLDARRRQEVPPDLSVPYITGKRLSPFDPIHVGLGYEYFQSPTSRGNDCQRRHPERPCEGHVPLSVPYIAGKQLSRCSAGRRDK